MIHKNCDVTIVINDMPKNIKRIKCYLLPINLYGPTTSGTPFISTSVIKLYLRIHNTYLLFTIDNQTKGLFLLTVLTFARLEVYLQG